MKRLLKCFLYCVAVVLVAPLAIPERLARKLTGRDFFFEFQSELLALVPGKTGQFIRNAYYFLTLRRCPLHCTLLAGMMFTHSDAEVGKCVYIGAYCVIGTATLGDYTMLADHVQILSGKSQHGHALPEVPFQFQPRCYNRVTVGRNVWLGAGSIVMADVGEDSIIGAGSVVTKPIPSKSVAAGNPARVIRATYPAEKPTGADAPA